MANSPVVPLRPREKQSLYQSLAQLARSGVSLPSALEKLLPTARGSLRKLLKSLRTSITRGETVGEAFARERDSISPLEANVIAAVERSGRLDDGLRQLALYFGALAKARDTVIRRSGYPVFVLHFGIFALALPTLVTAGTTAYLRQTLTLLGWIYLVSIAVSLGFALLRDLAATSTTFDRLLRRLPIVGKVRRSFASARFAMIYAIQLEAGVNVIDALIMAGRASQSGVVRHVVDVVVPEVRAGSPAGPLLAVSDAFPEEMTRAIVVGEQSGRLDEELNRVAAEAQVEALTRLDSGAEWLSKLIYFAVLIYVSWRVISTYRDVLSIYGKLLEF